MQRAISLLVILLLVCSRGQAAEEKRESRPVKVQATDTRVRSGFRVRKGDWLELEIKGKWRMWDRWPYIQNAGHTSFKKVNALGYLGTLICQIGDGKPFAVGGKLPFQAPSSGEVTFWPNRPREWSALKADGALVITVHAGDHLGKKRERLLAASKKAFAALQSDPEIKAALEAVNAARKAAGLQPIGLSLELSQACGKHVRYLILNKGNPLTRGMKAHAEHKELKGYTPEGAKAAKYCVIAYVPPGEAVKQWLASFYHRIPLLQPNLKSIGIGQGKKDDYQVSLIDCISGLGGVVSKPIVYYPAPNQKGIPLEMGPELPDPLPRGHRGTAGFPITVYFTSKQKVTGVKITLSEAGGKAVKSYVSTPQSPATTWTQWNTVCLIPASPLKAGTTYEVTLRCQVNGKPLNETWKFTTTSKGG